MRGLIDLSYRHFGKDHSVATFSFVATADVQKKTVRIFVSLTRPCVPSCHQQAHCFFLSGRVVASPDVPSE